MDLSRVEAEFARLRSALQIPEVWKLNTDGREFQVGDEAKARGLTAKFPVVLIPGIISTGLESWSTSPEYREFFRMRVWGGTHMVSQVMYNREKVSEVMILQTEVWLSLTLTVVDGFPDARPCNWAGPIWRQSSGSRRIRGCKLVHSRLLLAVEQDHRELGGGELRYEQPVAGTV
jgi:hypothetical protein